MQETKAVALVAHDNRKEALLEWVKWNRKELCKFKLICTGTTGKLVQNVLEKSADGSPDMQLLKSGPLGGDQQLGAMIAEGHVGILIFLWDPMEPQPHDVDIKALLRLAVLYNVPTACNRATADYLISSTLLGSDYEPDLPDYSGYLNRLSPSEK